MKILKLVILILVLALIPVLVTACGAPEEEPVIEEPVEDEEPEGTEEPVSDGTAPELLWSVPHENRLHSVAVSPDGETVAVGEYLSTYVYHLADGALEDVFVYKHSVEDLEFSPDGSLLGAGLSLYGTVLTDVLDSAELQLHGGYNNRLAFSPDGTHVATGNRNRIVWLWRVDDGEQVAILEAPEADWVWGIEYHPSGSLLAVTHYDGNVHFWDVEDQSIARTLQLDVLVGSTTNSFRFSPDGTVMAGLVQEDWVEMVRLWTVDEDEQLAELVIPKNVRDLAFSPDGNLLAVASQSATTIWDVATETLLYTLDQTFDPSITDWPIAVAFTPDGGHVAVIRWDGMLELWRLPGADPLTARPRDIRQPPPLPSDVLFDAGSAELKETAFPELEALAEELLAEFSKATITFIGHTTSYSAPDHNLQLSTDRANAVKAWFENWAGENGADGWVLLAEGRGCTELRVPDFDVEGNFLEAAGALNRRVEIEIEDAD